MQTMTHDSADNAVHDVAMSEPSAPTDPDRTALEALGIDALRKMSRGRFTGGYSMRKADLIDRLLAGF